MLLFLTGIKFQCCCGSCDIGEFLEGKCPKHERYPFLAVEEGDSWEKQTLESKLYKEWNEMNSKFINLVSETMKWLKNSTQTPCEVKINLGNLNLIREVEEKFNAAETFEDIFQLLWKSSSWSWFHFDVLEQLVNTCKIPTGGLEGYQHDFKQYCERRVFECPLPIEKGYSPPRDTALIVKFQPDLRNAKLLQLNEVLYRIRAIIKAKKFLKVATVKGGCTEVFFTLPRALAQEVFPLTPKQEELLVACGVLQYYIYPDPGI